MCFTCNISAGAREKLAIMIGVLNCCIALFGIALIGIAIYMKISIESRMMMLEGYDTGLLPHFLLAVGIKVVVLHVITFKIVYDCSSYEMNRNCVNFLLFAVLLSFILVWFLLAGGLMCFTHRSVIEESLQNGLGSVMKRYKTEMLAKVTLDKLQQEYHCCGSNGYSDWFDINWVNEESLNVKNPDIIRKLKAGLYYTDDVPYSCCDVASARPCVHHDVKDKSMHVHYGSITLYQPGCSSVLMDFFENKILVPTGWSVITAFFLQFITVVLMRYLQTSLAEARDMEDPMGYGTGYCIPGCPCECCTTGDPMKYVKRKKRARNDVEYGMDDAPDYGMGGGAPDYGMDGAHDYGMDGGAPDYGMGGGAPDYGMGGGAPKYGRGGGAPDYGMGGGAPDYGMGGGAPDYGRGGGASDYGMGGGAPNYGMGGGAPDYGMGGGAPNYGMGGGAPGYGMGGGAPDYGMGGGAPDYGMGGGAHDGSRNRHRSKEKSRKDKEKSRKDKKDKRRKDKSRDSKDRSSKADGKTSSVKGKGSPESKTSPKAKKSPKKSSKSPKRSPKTSSKSPKRSPKTSSKSPKRSPKTSSKSPKRSPKTSPKSQKKSPKRSPKSPKRSPKTSPKSPKRSPKRSPKSPKRSPKTSPKSQKKRSPKTSPKSLKRSPKSLKRSPKSLKRSPKSLKRSPKSLKTSPKSLKRSPKRSPKKLKARRR
ncbi:uncharacterized protein LOC117323596 [Pecten maximus]|uniref:uncharacterized protein LOC117323596 n=1 Tax=Pecten maximus TaxID=6579 RepID=UPI001458D79B|nr:uncharacterized protein LOC117323596 [Pecten maximus]